MKKTISTLLALCLTLSLFTACSAKPSNAGKGTPEQMVPFTDSAGRTVFVPANITKIALSGPLAQIVLFPLAPDKFVGIALEWDAETAKFLDPRYLELPVLGQLYGTKGELNLEELLLAAPDVVIDVGEPKDSIAADMDSLQKQTGIPFVHITAGTDTMGEAYRLLGELLGMEDEAEALAEYCENTLASALLFMEKVGKDNKKTLLYCLGNEGLNVIAKGSYHAEILDLMSDNAAVVDNPSAKGTGNETDMEQLLLWDPEVIIFAPDSIYDTAADDAVWRQLRAVSGSNYYEAPNSPYNWLGFPPSVQRYLGMFWLGELLYPEYTDYDLFEKVSEYFALFFHCDLTREQFDDLMANAQ